MAKIAIVYYSMYGHIRQLAEAEKKGVEKAGVTVDLFQIPETLPQDVLDKMHAPAKDADVPILEDPTTLESYDAFLIGIPTRYGNFPAQWKTFWDKTGKQWASGGFYGKMAGVFISTASLGGGQESTALASMSTFAHHGIIYVPFGYAKAFPHMSDLSEVHGGSPWGAGTFASGDGSRQPTARELEIANIQGEVFAQTVQKHFGCLHGQQESNGASKTAPAAAPSGVTGTASESAAKKSGHPQQPAEREEGDEKDGPCGLPMKCTVS